MFVPICFKGSHWFLWYSSESFSNFPNSGNTRIMLNSCNHSLWCLYVLSMTSGFLNSSGVAFATKAICYIDWFDACRDIMSHFSPSMIQKIHHSSPFKHLLAVVRLTHYVDWLEIARRQGTQATIALTLRPLYIWDAPARTIPVKYNLIPFLDIVDFFKYHLIFMDYGIHDCIHRDTAKMIYSGPI